MRVQILALVLIVTCIIGFILVNKGGIEGEFLPEYNGYYYVSDIQDDNSNSSYSVIFHDVNFTFLYWFWPQCWLENNVKVYIAEQAVSVYVEVTFPDNSSEILTLIVDNPSSCLIGISSTLHGVSSSHSNPKAGIATAETEELHSSWVYIVSSV